VSRSRRCWDGAIGGLGNPVLAGVAEALANGVEPQAIRVLSIGSGGIVLPQAGGGEDDATAKLMQRRQAPSRARDLKKLTDALLGHPPDGASLLHPDRPAVPQSRDELVARNPTDS